MYCRPVVWPSGLLPWQRLRPFMTLYHCYPCQHGVWTGAYAERSLLHSQLSMSTCVDGLLCSEGAYCTHNYPCQHVLTGAYAAKELIALTIIHVNMCWRALMQLRSLLHSQLSMSTCVDGRLCSEGGYCTHDCHVVKEQQFLIFMSSVGWSCVLMHTHCIFLPMQIYVTICIGSEVTQFRLFMHW